MASPSTANGTAANGWSTPGTNVISGCSDAADAPCLRKGLSSSLGSAPLEWRTVVPFQDFFWLASSRATAAMERSGTQSQRTSALRLLFCNEQTTEWTRRANAFPLRLDAAVSRQTISAIRYPQLCNATASALPRLPGPMIEILFLTTEDTEGHWGGLELVGFQSSDSRFASRSSLHKQKSRFRVS